MYDVERIPRYYQSVAINNCDSKSKYFLPIHGWHVNKFLPRATQQGFLTEYIVPYELCNKYTLEDLGVMYLT